MGSPLPKLTLEAYLAWENDPDTRRIEVFRIGADGLWVLHDMSERAVLTLASVACEMTMADVFDGVDSA